ncbi:hypothetical protein BCON_0064g00420 [Botryotinia convoluta]|uniref:Uncharacterized protein n=1 Tax=Botryotinia convoluta TaxID=54673 RepID=A0A4Z1IDB8_9HELO|nr:hypothetical protein BCON_0064g00420 [Botryotinia convoluta]
MTCTVVQLINTASSGPTDSTKHEFVASKLGRGENLDAAIYAVQPIIMIMTKIYFCSPAAWKVYDQIFVPIIFSNAIAIAFCGPALDSSLQRDPPDLMKIKL